MSQRNYPNKNIGSSVLLLILFSTVTSIRGVPMRPEHRQTFLAFSLSPANTTISGDSGFRLFRAQQQKSTASEPEAKPEKKTGRAVLEYFAVIAVPQAIYWAGWWGEYKPWHYRLNWKDQSKRLFSMEAWKFDSNNFKLNWTHALSGAGYYNFARSNRLGRFESLLFTLGGSFYWEYIGEWREVVSINDNIVTILGGVPIGEACYNLGKYFLSQSGTIHQILSFLNPVLKLNHWLDRKKGNLTFDEPEPGWHDFRLALGLWSDPISNQKWMGKNMFAHAEAQLLSIPDAENPGCVAQKIGATLFSGISLDILSSKGHVDEVSFSFRSVYLGYFRKMFDQDLNGYRFYLGLGSAFSYFKQRSIAFYDSSRVRVKDIHLLDLDKPRDFRDKFAAVHVIGPVFDLNVRKDKFKIRLMAEAYADFSMVNALALNEYSTAYDIRGAKTTLIYYGYYYGVGGSFSLWLNAEYGPMIVRGRFIRHNWGSVEGYDSFQGEVQDDFHITDSRASLYLSAGFQFSSSPFGLIIAYEKIGRRGVLKNITQTEHETRWSSGFVFRF